MTPLVSAVSPEDSLAEAVECMAAQRISSIVVEREGRAEGILTEVDVLAAVNARRTLDTPVKQVMSTPVVSVPLGTPLPVAYHLMVDQRLRHLLITAEDGSTVGIITETDFRSCLDGSLGNLPAQIDSLMQVGVPVLPSDAKLVDAVELMHACAGICVVVLEERRPVGILTLRDLVRLMSGQGQGLERPLRECMSSPVHCLTTQDSPLKAWRLLQAHSVRQMVVITLDGHFAGLLSMHDILRGMSGPLGIGRDGPGSKGRAPHEIMLRGVFDSIEDVLGLLSTDGLVLDANSTALELAGVGLREVLGKCLWNTAWLAHEQGLRERLQRAVKRAAQGETLRFEASYTGTDGSERHLDVSLNPIRDANERVIYLVLHARDVTERHRAELVLRQNEAVFRQLFERAKAVELLIDPRDGQIISANPAAAAYYGWSVEELCRMRIWDINVLTPDEVHEEMRCANRDHRSHFYFRHRLASGEIRDVEVHSGPMSIDGRRLLYSIIHDITERRRAERALQESEKRFRGYFQLGLVGTAILSSDGVWQDTNDELCRLLGYTRDQLTRMCFLDQVHPDERASEEQNLQQLIDGLQDNYRGDMRLLRADGSEVQAHVAVQALREESRGLSGFAVMLLDISQRKHDEEELRKLSRAVEQSPLSIVITDPNGSIEYINPRVSEVSGYPPQKLLGQNPRLFQSGETSPETYEDMWHTITRGEVWAGTLRNRRQDGRLYWESARIVPVADESGQVTHYLGIKEDITDRLQAEVALRSSEERYRSVVENVKEVIFQTDVDRKWVFLNPAWEEITGFPVSEVLGHDVQEYISQADRKVVDQAHEELISGATDYLQRTVRCLTRTGGYRWVDVAVHTLRGPDNVITGCMGTITDVTERLDWEERLKLSASVFANTRDGVVITDPHSIIIDVNAAFTRLTGYEREEAIGQHTRLLKSGRHGEAFYESLWQELRQNGFWQGEIQNRRKDGSVYEELLSINAVYSEQGGVTHYVAVFSDITPIKEGQRRLERLAHYDPLTRLPNRVLLSDRITQALAHAKRQNTVMAVCYLDLDGFKPINDRHGHHVGDRLLMEIASRLKELVRDSDTVARLGGDEFIILLTDLTSAHEAENALSRILQQVSEPMRLGDELLRVSGSIGVTLYPEDDSDVDTLLRHADQAMYRAKEAGRNTFHLFNWKENTPNRDYREMRETFHRAMLDNEFCLYYQPKVNLRTGRVVGAEALIRWKHPDRGLLLPLAFLADVEAVGLSVELDQWVVEQALRQMDAWAEEGFDLAVSVNVCSETLQRSDLPLWLARLLRRHPNIKPRQLELEILETAALEDIGQVSEVITACARLGIAFALDDFGTGYSSLTYLKRLPAHTMKIDRSFIADMLEDPEDLAIVEGVLGLANAFGRTAVAEGVEHPEQGKVLLKLGCDIVQGFGIARPMRADQWLDWLRGFELSRDWNTDDHGVRRELLPMLSAELAHRQWLDKLLATIGQPDFIAAELDEDALECRLGRWYNGRGRYLYGHMEEFQVIEATHHRLHESASALLRAVSEGETHIVEQYRQEVLTYSEQMLQQLRTLRKVVI